MAQRKAIKAQNAAELAQWKRTYKEVRRQLGVAYGRTQTQISEANRDKVRNQMAARVAGRQAKGSRSVKAAQMGIQGRRASRDIYVPVDREVANAVSDEARNATIKEQNALNHFNDTAQAAIINLNNNAPLARAVPSIGGIIAGAASTALNIYSSMSPSQQADFKNTFKSSDTSPAINQGGAVYKVNTPRIGGR